MDCDVTANCGKIRIPREFGNKVVRFFLKNVYFNPKYHDYRDYQEYNF